MMPCGGRGAGIGWQQSDFGLPEQHDHLVVAARPHPNQCRPGPGVDQSAAGSTVQHGVTTVGRIDQARPPNPVLTGQDRRDQRAVPRDQLGGPGLFVVDAPGHPIIGISGDDPDLAARSAPVERDLTRQPLAVRGVDDARDRTLDRKLHIPRRAGPPTAQKALHRTGIAAVVDDVGKRGCVRGQRRAVDLTHLLPHRLKPLSRAPPVPTPSSSCRPDLPDRRRA